MGADVSPNDTFMQMAGSGCRVDGPDLLRAMDEHPSLRAHLILYAHTLMRQMSYTALSDGRSKLDERLARWLLMAHDRAEDDTFTLTHEFLAVMLGVRRAGVTTALQSLERRGVIQTRRCAITILDRDILIDAANGSYGAPEAEFERLFMVTQKDRLALPKATSAALCRQAHQGPAHEAEHAANPSNPNGLAG